jgi:hypothetical protein
VAGTAVARRAVASSQTAPRRLSLPCQPLTYRFLSCTRNVKVLSLYLSSTSNASPALVVKTLRPGSKMSDTIHYNPTPLAPISDNYPFTVPLRRLVLISIYAYSDLGPWTGSLNLSEIFCFLLQ